MSPVLSHLGMGLGLGGLGFLLVVGVRGPAVDTPREVPPAPAERLLLYAKTTSGLLDAGSRDAPPVRPNEAASVGLDASLVDASREDAPSGEMATPGPKVFRVASLAKDSALTLMNGTVGRRPFLTAVAAAGLSRTEAYRVLRALSPLHDLNHTSPTDAFQFAREKRTGHVVAFEYITSPVSVFQARDDAGSLTAKVLDLHVDLARRAVPITVTRDLRTSLQKAGLAPDVFPELESALDGHTEIADVQAGARLNLVVTEERADGEFLRDASLDALEYTPAEPGAAPLRLYRFPALDHEKLLSGASSGVATFYDGKGQQPAHGGWRIPVPRARLASRFNPRRMHPTLHVIMPHNGVDFAAPTGTPVYAAASGTVKTAGDSGPCGNMVQIEHASGIQSSYCHLSRFATGVRVGERVETRQLIGYVGQTGRATGPHLHFAIKRNGVFIDPLVLKLDGMRVVPPAQRDDFDAARAELDKALDAIARGPRVTGVDGATPESPSLAAESVSFPDAAAGDGGTEPVLDEAP